MELGYLRIALAVTAVKLLLIPAYKSTDFEVHRNWMAITHSLPLSQWYLNEISPWTLDYPPFFAYFEFCISKIAVFFDREMLEVQNLDYDSQETILFQRLSVIASDLVLISAAWFAVHKTRISLSDRLKVFFLVVSNAGLLMIDHIHFQYNGFLIGILMWSALAVEVDQCLLAALIYSSLLNMKHIFVYSAPVYFGYLLSHYCLKSGTQKLYRLGKLAAIVICVCLTSFGPFLIHRQLPQILSRLFPFGRGLCHAYWAPNAWAVYSFADKVLTQLLRLTRPEFGGSSANMTGGLVGEQSFIVLPNIPPGLSLLLTFLFASIPAALQFRKPDYRVFTECIAYACLCGFVWGYHVHEKAILPVLIPLTIIVFRNATCICEYHRRHFLSFSTIAHYSLTPILHEAQEYPIKILLVVIFAVLAWNLEKKFPSQKPRGIGILDYTQTTVFLAIVGIETTNLIFRVLNIVKYEFLPLMMTSTFCGTGIFLYWAMWTRSMLDALIKKKII